MKNNQKYLVIFVGMIALALPGCRFRREISVSMPAESEEQIQVESNTNIEKEDGRNYLESVKLKRNDNTDLNQFAQLLLGVPTIEEAIFSIFYLALSAEPARNQAICCSLYVCCTSKLSLLPSS